MRLRLKHYLPDPYRLLLEPEYGAIRLVAVVGLTLSLVALLLIRQQLDSNRMQEFEWVAHNRIRALSYGIENNLLAVATIRDHVVATGGVKREEFEQLAASLLQRHRGIESLAWLPRVTEAERAAFDASIAREKSLQGMTQHKGKGALASAAEREVHFPIRYRVPAKEQGIPTGFDMASIPNVLGTLERARDRGTIAASGRIDYPSLTDTGQYGFVVAAPVYTRGAMLQTVEQRRAALSGFIAGFFQFDSLSSAAISLLEPRGVEILILDQSAPPGERFLHFYNSRLSPRQVDQSNYLKWLRDEREPKVEERIAVVDRQLVIVCGRTELFRSAEAFHQGPWMALIVGLLFTILLSFYLARIRENMLQRAAMERQLVEREALFREMTETVDEAFWAASADGSELLYLSPTFGRMLGSASDQWAPSLADTAIPEDRSALAEALKRTGREGTDAEVVHRVRRADGVLRWVRTRGFAVRDSGGCIQRLVGFMEDITERKLADEALRDSEAKLRDLFQHSPDIIMTVDEQGRILLMNRSIPRLPAERAVGHSSLALMPRGLRKWFRKSLKKVFRKGKTRQFEYSENDGTYWEGRIVPIANGEGVVTAAMVIAADVTEKRDLEAQALRNARLASIGVLAAGVAHEINNPNNAIQFNAAMMSRAWRDVTPILQEYYDENGDFALGGLAYSKSQENFPRLLTEITRNSDRIRRIVQNLKHMSRQDKGELTEQVDVQQVLEATVMILHNQIQKFTDRCGVDLPDGLPPVRGNSQQLEQVFINLLLNALQALPQRSHGVDISAGYDRSSGRLWIAIKDQGHGIAERDLGRLTEPFFTTRTDAGGMGLGLSISRSIVERHGGSLEFESEWGVGSTVTVRLPVIEEA